MQVTSRGDLFFQFIKSGVFFPRTIFSSEFVRNYSFCEENTTAVVGMSLLLVVMHFFTHEALHMFTVKSFITI